MGIHARWALVLLMAVLGGSCRASARVEPPPPAPPHAEPSQPIAPPSPVATIKTPGGRTITILQSDELDPGEVAPEVEPAATPSDLFRGTDRRASKLSIVAGNSTPFSSVEALRASAPNDTAMMKRQPPISRSANSTRVKEERRRIALDSLLCAASREDDNDFHLIVCDRPEAPIGQRSCLTVEVSGLPSSGSFRARLEAARNQYRDLVGGTLPGSRYHFYQPPIPITVTGSLFYDISHKPGVVGPSAFRPDTAWEIHPIDGLVERAAPPTTTASR